MQVGKEYVTFLGGTGAEGPNDAGIKVDNAGNVYVTGTTASPDFPKVNAIQPALRGGTDAFISKLDSFGSALIFSTYLGGSNGYTLGSHSKVWFSSSLL